MSRSLAALLTGGAFVWAFAVIAAPLSVRRPAAAVPGAFVYAAGALVCHQQQERSFHLGAVQLPVCARCLALYVAGAAGAAAGWLGPARRRRRSRLLLGLAAAPVAVTVCLEWTGVAAPGNLLRALSAVPLGGIAGTVFVRALRAEGPPGRMGYHAGV